MITLDLAKISDNQGSTCGDCSRVGAVDVSDVVVSDGCDNSITNYTLSPGGQKYYLPSSVDLVEMPFANQVFDSLDKAFKFYKEYGRLGVKKGYNVANFGSEEKVGKFVKERRTGSRRCSAMDRQRNETKRLDHESNSSSPSTLSRWFIENNAAEIFMRAIFYKLQEEILASCMEMQIKKMSEDVNGVIHLEIRDVKVKDKIFKVCDE
ncbi:hypothetical protein ACET3Z_010757 [Daucus carota]